MDDVEDVFYDCNNEIDIMKKYFSYAIPNNYQEFITSGIHLFIITLDKSTCNFFMKVTLINDSQNDMYGLIQSSEYTFYSNEEILSKKEVIRKYNNSKKFKKDWTEYNDEIYKLLCKYFNEYIIDN